MCDDLLEVSIDTLDTSVLAVLQILKGKTLVLHISLLVFHGVL